MEDPIAEAGEVADAITGTLENLRLVVAAFGIAVGIGDVKGIEYVFAPVMNGSGTFKKLRKMCTFSANDPVTEQFFGKLGVRRVHKKEKVVFQIICLFQSSRQAEDNPKFLPFFIRELLRRLVEQRFRVLAEPSPLTRQVFLHFLPYSLQRPDYLPGNMVAVDRDGGLGKTNLRNLPEMRIHIHDEILDLFPVFELTEIADQIRFLAVWKDIHDLSVPWVGQDRLVFLSVGIPFEFINGENFRQLLAGVGNQIEITESCADRNIVFLCYVRCGDSVSKVLNNSCILAARHTVVARKKAVFLVKPLAAAVAYISSLTEMKVDILSKRRYVPDLLYSVVVDLIGFGTAAWAVMPTPGKFYLYVLFLLFIPYVFDDYIFQSEQFCGIIFVEHRVHPFC